MLACQICSYILRMGFKGHMMRCMEKNRCKRSEGDIWWQNEEVNDAISRRQDTQFVTYRNGTQESMMRYKSLMNEAMQAVSKAIGGKGEEALTESKNLHIECFD